MNHPTPPQLRERLKALDYPVFTGDYNLTLVGLRSAERAANRFDDVIGVLYPVGKRWHLHWFDATTDPGSYWLENPMNVEGTAIVAAGHYPGCWQVGAHQNRNRALVQRGPMTVHRDGDRDDEIDTQTATQTGLFGLNLHHAAASGVTLAVDRWSAGCQVLARKVDFDLLMALVGKSAAIYGPRFSYSLLDERDFAD